MEIISYNTNVVLDTTTKMMYNKENKQEPDGKGDQKMPHYLRDLWLGNICESERMPTSPEYRRQCEQAEALREQLAQGLPDGQNA